MLPHAYPFFFSLQQPPSELTSIRCGVTQKNSDAGPQNLYNGVFILIQYPETLLGGIKTGESNNTRKMSIQSNLVYLATALVVWFASVIVYRRFFHPLAKIPGPFLAAVTHFYIVKFNLFSGRSQFYLQVEKLHQKYGNFNVSYSPLVHFRH